MIKMQCLNFLDSCQDICDDCRQTHEEYLKKTEEQYIADAIALLESHGYKVVKYENDIEPTDRVLQVS